MKYIQIAQFVRRIAQTCDAELNCGECSQLTPEYVDALLAGQDGMDRWARVRQHLEQCNVCTQETLTLHSIAKLELDGGWPPVAQLLDWVTQPELRA